MPVSTLLRVINGENDIKAVYSNGYTNRTFAVGTSWTKLRIGFRYCIDPLGLTSDRPNPGIYFGLASGSTYPVTSGSCVNFIGVRYRTDGNLAYHAGPPAYYTPLFSTWTTMKKSGASITEVGNIGACYFPADPANVRNAFILEFTKGSPNWTIAQIGSQNTATAQTDISLATLISAMEALTMADAATALGSPNYATTAASAIAFSEAAGSIDTINIAWQATLTQLEISEALYAVVTA